jgi:hypothetical protein
LPADAHEWLDISFKPSRVLGWIAVATYLFVGLSLLFANIPLWALGALWLALYFQAVMQWRRIRTPMYPFELTRLRWQNPHWLLTLDSALRHPITHPDEAWALVWLRTLPYFIFLRFKPIPQQPPSHPTKPRSLLIVKDQLTEKDYRQLLLWLNMLPMGTPPRQD